MNQWSPDPGGMSDDDKADQAEFDYQRDSRTAHFNAGASSPSGYNPGSAESLFGSKTGKHSHPATHPSWMEFDESNCPACKGAK